MAKLFRDEVLNQRFEQMGIPSGISSRTISIYTVGLVLVFLAAISLIVFGSYARKSTVNGYLLPDKGLVKIATSRNGRVVERHVVEGQSVTKGELLFKVDVGTETQSGRTAELIIGSIRERRSLLEQEMERLYAIEISEEETLDASISSKENEIQNLRKEIIASQASVQLLTGNLHRLETLVKKEYVSPMRRDLAERDLMLAKVDTIALERELAAARGELMRLKANRSGLEDKQDNVRSQMRRELVELDERMADLSGRNLILIRAPTVGTVTRVTVVVGSTVSENTVMATIVPEGSRLEANLFLPSSAAGFVFPGMPVRLRYEAFPYQKFGVYEATISTISQTAVDVSELPFAVNSNEPLYLATADLETETIDLDDRSIRLQSGSKFRADLIFEERPIFEWFVGPLRSVQGVL